MFHKGLDPTVFSISNKYPNTFTREPGSSISIVSDYGLDAQGSIPGSGKGFFL
jgi:hypothetical protein